jgi:plastocyanin
MRPKTPLLAALATLACAAPASAATVTVHVGYQGLNFHEQNVVINPGDTIHWTWDSGHHSVTSGDPMTGTPNGTFDSGATLLTTGAALDHTFANAGTYTYFCRAHYRFGMVGTITVNTGTAPPPNPPDTPPTTDFSFMPASPTTGQAVGFTASATDPDGDAIASYKWHFDDGTPDQTTPGPTVSHTYQSAGAHPVTLVATDARNTPSQPVTHTVTVSAASPPPPPPPKISALTASSKQLCTNRSARCRHPGLHLRFKLNQHAKLVLTVARRSGRAVGRPIKVSGKSGTNDILFSGTGLKPGRYVLTMTATAPSGAHASSRLKFSVKSG